MFKRRIHRGSRKTDNKLSWSSDRTKRLKKPPSKMPKKLKLRGIRLIKKDWRRKGRKRWER